MMREVTVVVAADPMICIPCCVVTELCMTIAMVSAMAVKVKAMDKAGASPTDTVLTWVTASLICVLTVAMADIPLY